MKSFARALSLIIVALVFIQVSWAAQAAELMNQRPMMRIGLFSTDQPVTLIVERSSNIIGGESKDIFQTIPAEQIITLSYDRANGQYTASSGEWLMSSAEYLVVRPVRSASVITITSYDNPPDWNSDLNDNQFLGRIVLRYAAATDQIWVINSIGIENYIKGVAEASNENQPAYLKTLYTAARSYAYYHYLNPTKHADENFILDTSGNDQVYRGYGFTQRAPNIVAAVEATTGEVVHYQAEPVVTPYFSQSDGRTRAWSEVWSGDYPYLLSVDDPCCVADELLGHGVGLSAKGARYFAEEQNWHWREILQYYYQGTTLKQLW